MGYHTFIWLGIKIHMRSSVQNRRTNQKRQNEICTPLYEGDNHLFDAQVCEQIQGTYLYIFMACVVCNVIVLLFLVHCMGRTTDRTAHTRKLRIEVFHITKLYDDLCQI